jgi:hypothetical protein
MPDTMRHICRTGTDHIGKRVCIALDEQLDHSRLQTHGPYAVASPTHRQPLKQFGPEKDTQPGRVPQRLCIVAVLQLLCLQTSSAKLLNWCEVLHIYAEQDAVMFAAHQQG